MRSKLITIALLSLLVLVVLCIAIRDCRSKTSTNPVAKADPYSYKVNTHDPSLKGYLLTSPYELFKWNKGQLVIMGMDGHIYVQRAIPGAAYDFRQWKINGKVYYSYIINDTNAYHIKRIALTAGYVVLLDSALNEIKQVHLMPHDDIIINNHQALDLHDLILFSENHYIVIAAYEKKVSNIPASLSPSPYIKVAADIIQEVDNGKVIWQWDGTKYPEFYVTATEKNHFQDTTMTQDYIHINSMCLDPRDGNLICSFRSNDQVVKINRHTGNIMWRLGGKNSDFSLTDSMVFQRQHHATLVDNNKTLLVLDNGDILKRKTSRVLEFVLDEKHKKVTAFKSFTIPAPYNQYMGSVTKRNGHYFIGGGTGKYIMEIDPGTGKKGFDYSTNQLSYRDYWVESIHGLEKH